MVDLTTGELFSMDLNYLVIITANIINQDKTVSLFLKPGSPSVRRCGLCSLWCSLDRLYSIGTLSSPVP